MGSSLMDRNQRRQMAARTPREPLRFFLSGESQAEHDDLEDACAKQRRGSTR